MKQHLSFIIPLVTLLATGCVRDELNELSENQAIDLPTVTAGFEQNETRTFVEEGNLLRWTENDRISFFYKSTLNLQYIFDGETGDNAGTFSPAKQVVGTGNDLAANYAIYPYASDVSILENGTITATLPAEQSYAENSFGLGANTMVAMTQDTDDTYLKFKNVGGYLKLMLYGADVTVKSIILTGNNNERIAGKASITPSYDTDPTSEMDSDASQSITLDCGDGITIGTTEDNATAFWLVVPPTTFGKGFKVRITDINGGIMTKSTDNEIAVKRNVIKPMAAFEVKLEKPVPKNQIWYTNGSTTTATTPYSTDAFGANIVSNLYDATQDQWVISFDGEITSIGHNAFYYCSSLTSVTIPEGVTSIGDYAFWNCHSLTSVTIPESVTSIGDYAFDVCRDLTSVTIPEGVTSIGEGAFHACHSLTSVTIPEGVTSIGGHAFDYCSSLTSFYGKYSSSDNRCLVIDGVLNSFAPAGLNTYAIPDGVTSIGDRAFSCCRGLTSVTIPESVTSIGGSAFDGCSSLTSVTIPESVTSIGGSAFFDCSSLTSVAIPESVTSIGGSAFSYCSSLASVTIPESVTSIELCAFYGCSSLTSVTIPEGVTSIGDGAFLHCNGLTSVTIPEGVTSIGHGAFCGCSSLTSFYGKYSSSDNRCLIIDGVLNSFAPAGLNTYTIPDSVTSIEDYAFYKCSGLTSVTIPDGVTSIGDGAFSDCSSLTSVYCEPTTPPALGNNAFDSNASDLKIFVPTASLDAYLAADGWNAYSSSIEDY